MEVKINREIRNYTEAMFFGLSLRQFIFSLCAVVVAVGLYFLLKPYLGTETVSWVCILGAAPFAALGFVKYNGMTAEKAIYAWIKSEFLMPKKLVFHSTNTYSNSPDSFKYYHFVDAENEDEFNAYVEKCRELSLYDTGVSAEYGDKLISLSTCEYSRTNGRLVVVAKLVK